MVHRNMEPGLANPNWVPGRGAKQKAPNLLPKSRMLSLKDLYGLLWMNMSLSSKLILNGHLLDNMNGIFFFQQYSQGKT